ncbi:uncharacterized protein LOC144877702 [Branchiostoma floridae x Branchiostoma japonicum]
MTQQTSYKPEGWNTEEDQSKTSVACCRNVDSSRFQDLPLQPVNQAVISNTLNDHPSSDNSPNNDSGEPHDYTEIDGEDNDVPMSPYESGERNCEVSGGNCAGSGFDRTEKLCAVCNVSADTDWQKLDRILPSSLSTLVLTPYAMNETSASIACCRNVYRRFQDLSLNQANQAVASNALDEHPASNHNSSNNDSGDPHEYAEIDDEDIDVTISPYGEPKCVVSGGYCDGSEFDHAEKMCAVCNVSTEMDLQNLHRILPSSLFALVLRPYALNGTSGLRSPNNDSGEPPHEYAEIDHEDNDVTISPYGEENQVVTANTVNDRSSNDNSPFNDSGEPPHEYAEIDDEDDDVTISPYGEAKANAASRFNNHRSSVYQLNDTYLLPGLQRLDLTRLHYLYIGHGKLRVISNNSFENLSSLQVLQIKETSVSILKENTFCCLTNLTDLLLSSNQISVIEPNAFLTLPSLRTLNLADNRLSLLRQDYFTGLGGLHLLNLSNNEICNIDNGVFQHLLSLRHLNIDHNRIQTIENGNILWPKFLITLSLKYNEIFSFDPHALRFIKELQILDLSHNRLTSLGIPWNNAMLALKSNAGNDNGEVRFTGNPFRCTCSNDYLRRYGFRILPLADLMEDLVCSYPPQLAGKPLPRIPPSMFTCASPVVHVTRQHGGLSYKCEAFWEDQPQITWVVPNGDTLRLSNRELYKTTGVIEQTFGQMNVTQQTYFKPEGWNTEENRTGILSCDPCGQFVGKTRSILKTDVHTMQDLQGGILQCLVTTSTGSSSATIVVTNVTFLPDGTTTLPPATALSTKVDERTLQTVTIESVKVSTLEDIIILNGNRPDKYRTFSNGQVASLTVSVLIVMLVAGIISICRNFQDLPLQPGNQAITLNTSAVNDCPSNDNSPCNDSGEPPHEYAEIDDEDDDVTISPYGEARANVLYQPQSQEEVNTRQPKVDVPVRAHMQASDTYNVTVNTNTNVATYKQ